MFGPCVLLCPFRYLQPRCISLLGGARYPPDDGSDACVSLQALLDYEVDSDDEWEEEEPGESLSHSEGVRAEGCARSTEASPVARSEAQAWHVLGERSDADHGQPGERSLGLLLLGKCFLWQWHWSQLARDLVTL